MKTKLKKIDEQVVVVTGASSGIGRATAKAAAEQGARVVLAARDEPSLREAVDEIREHGGEAVYVVADVAAPEAAHEIARVAVETFGGIDTWVNNAGVSIYGEATKVPIEEARRLFDVNYWGMVYGSLAAVEHLRERGGALINVGSVVSDRAVPLQGHYSASKHAVKGFTDALRMELENEEAPISVTLIKPSSVATPFPVHAKNHMDAEPSLPAPLYAPDVVARTILECMQRPVREVSVGAGGRVMTRMGRAMPQLMDRYMEGVVWDQMKASPGDEAHGGTNGHSNLFAPQRGWERGKYRGHVMESSLFTQTLLHPLRTALVAIGFGAVAATLWRTLR